MKSPTLPLICGTALAVMCAASASHWWSVRNFVSAVDRGLPVTPESLPGMSLMNAPAPATIPLQGGGMTGGSPKAAEKPEVASRPIPKPQASPAGTGEESSKKEFYETLIQKLKRLEEQNQDLRDQMAETNRDMMKMQFQIDTHSESFRPMPISEEQFQPIQMNEDRSDTSGRGTPGVLPPRAEPVIDFPFGE